MRTFKLTIEMDVRVVVPDQFTQMLRDAATAQDASPFLSTAQAMFPDDDEGFTLHILKHGTRRHVRHELAALYESSGLGCTLSPVKATVIDRDPPTTPPIQAKDIDVALHGATLG